MLNVYIVDYYDLFKTNGLSTYVVNLVNRFHIEQIQLNYIWIKSGGKYKAPFKEIKNNIAHIFIPEDINISGRSDAVSADFIASSLTGKMNVIIHFNWINHCAFTFLLKQRVENCKVVLTKHCIPWRDAITENYSVFKLINKMLTDTIRSNNLHAALHRECLAYTSVDHVICVTNFAKETLLKVFQLPFPKLSVIYNGLEVGKKSICLKKSLKGRYGFSLKEKIILFAGAVQERKGIWDLIKAFDTIASHKNVRLVIAGNGQHSKVFETTKKRWSKITVTGALDKKTLYDFYRMADVGVVPSYVEQCSYTAIEMMHHGLPIIVSNVDGLAEIVPDDCGLKVPLVLGKTKAYIHPQKLADSILYFLNNPEIAREYAARAKQHARKNFTAKRMAAETIKVYEKLISEAHFPQPALPIAATTPLRSVVLPCYNAEKYLKECIDSVLLQSYSNLELIIIDDGSTDGSLSIIDTYKDARIIVIRNASNEGIVSSLNKGIRQAKGKYIARIDTDDKMHEDRLYKQVQFLEAKENEAYAMVGSHHYVIDQSGIVVILKQYPITNHEIQNLVYFQNPFSHPSVMIRSSVLKKYKYTSKYKQAEDYALWFKILANHKAANLPEYRTYYRVHGKNISIENQKTQNENSVALVSEALDKLGVDYDEKELAIHIAIVLGYGNRYFTTPEK